MTRGRKPALIPSRSLHMHLDPALAALIDERLWSDSEQRVPKGAYQEFFTEAAIRMLRQLPLDLSPYSGSIPLEHVVYAFAGTRDILKAMLERSNNANTNPGDAVKDRYLES